VLLRLLLLPRLSNVLRQASMRETVKASRLMWSGWMVGGRLLFLMRSALGLALLAAFVCPMGLRVV
jgi:dienelactone hydrolase